MLARQALYHLSHSTSSWHYFWNLLKMQIFEDNPKPTKSETLGVGSNDLFLNKATGDSDAGQSFRTADLVQCFSISTLLTSQIGFVVERSCCIVGCFKHSWPLGASSVPPTL
jgi:hypothetical protein